MFIEWVRRGCLKTGLSLILHCWIISQWHCSAESVVFAVVGVARVTTWFYHREIGDSILVLPTGGRHRCGHRTRWGLSPKPQGWLESWVHTVCKQNKTNKKTHYIRSTFCYRRTFITHCSHIYLYSVFSAHHAYGEAIWKCKNHHPVNMPESAWFWADSGQDCGLVTAGQNLAD